jgi:hypothetical protein
MDTQRPPSARRQIDIAIEAHMVKAAFRAASDPPVLAKAARAVRAAIELGLLTPGDLSGPIVREPS